MHLSMTRLFQSCNSVLSEQQRPLHYRALTKMALQKINIRLTGEALRKTAEDVREKMLLAGQYGTHYTGHPHYFAVKHEWFRVAQRMMAITPIVIPGNASSGIDGAFESLMRPMRIKNENAHLEMVYMARAKGLVIQSHVTQWFRQQWRSLYRHPDNYRQWRTPSVYDFGVEVRGHLYKIDIAGPNHHGRHGNSAKKKSTDLHLICDVSGSNIHWLSVYAGDHFAEVVIPEYGIPPINLIVWLNCAVLDIDYQHIKNQLTEPREIVAQRKEPAHV